ncbi:MAG: sulfurtransferase TusA family protein [Firmicutes bacterium]|nr:sulfurtransferase TusA family protein [Bacillota bacterium]
MQADIVYDAGPTGCGELVMHLFLTMRRMEVGQMIEVVSYDIGARVDIPAWCTLRAQHLVETRDVEGTRHYFIRRTGAAL